MLARNAVRRVIAGLIAGLGIPASLDIAPSIMGFIMSGMHHTPTASGIVLGIAVFAGFMIHLIQISSLTISGLIGEGTLLREG